jgi:hypothetical protein
MVIKDIKTFHSQAFQNLPKVAISGPKIYHLATLTKTLNWRLAGINDLSAQFQSPGATHGTKS